MMDVTEGQEMRVFDRNGHRYGWPEDGRVGRVTKIGRKYFTVEHANPGSRHMDSDQFRLEDGKSNDPYAHRTAKTLEQVARDRRAQAARETLERHAVELGPRCTLTVEQLEAMAAIADQ